MSMTKIKTSDLTKIAITVVLYIILSMVVPAASFGPVQFRVSELLNFLIIKDKKYAIGIIIGVAFTNLFSPYILDLVFGTAHTIIAIGMSYFLFRFVKDNEKMKYVIVTAAFSVLMFIVGIGIALGDQDMGILLPMYGTLFMSELFTMAIGAVIMYHVNKYEFLN